MKRNINEEVLNNFLKDRDDTGREIVISFRTGRKYYIETIGNGRMADWGSYNPSTGNIENKKGAGKFSGSITEEESLITKENGFEDIHYVKGGSPYSLIEEIDKNYPDKEKK
jgi:hypothetical protein